jgi:hypothetical protein
MGARKEIEAKTHVCKSGDNRPLELQQNVHRTVNALLAAHKAKVAFSK